MSWIADLAGKAESLLNNIDQSAAGAIQVNQGPSSASLKTSNDTSTFSNFSEPERKVRNETALEHLSKKDSGNTQIYINEQQSLALQESTKKTNIRTENFVCKKSKKDKEAALFDFLNSSSKLPSKSKSKANENISKKPSKTDITKSTSSTSLSSLSKHTMSSHPFPLEISRSTTRRLSKDETISMNKPTSNIDTGSTSSETDSIAIPNDSTASESEFEMISNAVSLATSDRESLDEFNEKKIDQQMENQMLRNEIAALHQELRSHNERNQRSKEELNKRNNDLKSKLDDLENEVQVKSSQNDAFQLELTKILKDLENSREIIENLEAEKLRILNDHSAGSGMHAQAMEQIQARVEETELLLSAERKKFQQTQQEFLANRDALNEDARKLAESLKKSQHDMQAEKKRVNSLVSELSSSQSSLALATQELTDYKAKATRILQSKEKLIASLKGGDDQDTTDTSSSIELDELRQDRDFLREELFSSRNELIHLKNKLQEMESQYQQDISLQQEDLDEVRQQLNDSERTKREVEVDVQRLRMEIQGLKESATQFRASCNSKMQLKDEEINRLRSQIMMRSVNKPEESELEERLKQLTETLIQKQTIVETLSSEKCSLGVQLERMESEVRRLRQENSSQMKITVDEVYSRTPDTNTSLFVSSSSESGMVGRVRNAASAVDKFSVRLGVFLRRYPMARLFVILYMGLLHLWVMIVLLTYSPEIHNHDYRPQQHLAPDNNGLPNEK